MTESGVGVSLRWNHWLLGMPMVLLPLLLGGARPWIWSPVVALFLLGCLVPTWKDHSFSLSRVFENRWSLVLALLFLYPFLQWVPLPIHWVDWLNPERAEWLQRSRIVARTASGTASITYMPLTTLVSWFWWIFLAVYALLLRRVIQAQDRLEWLFHILYGVAAFEAFYGLLQVLIPTLGVLWEAAGTGHARGTFVNRNHYANFLGMIWPLLLAHLLALKPASIQHRNRSYQEKERSNQTTQQQAFLAILIGLVLLALFFSASRGGIISSLVALTVFITFSGRNRGSTTFFLAACWLVMLAYGSIIGFDEILARFDIMEKSAPGRFKIWEDTRRLIGDHLWTGTGLGTYETVIRLYQSHLTDQFQIGHAHNDYLELAAELGIPAAWGIILLVWAYWWKTAYNLMRQQKGWGSFGSKAATPHEDSTGRRRVSTGLFDEDRLLRVGALAGSAAFLCHSWVEFNWQMPANQMIFIMLLVVMKEKQELTAGRTWL
ncbi:O-antigen ligase [Desulforhabdus sp. TSK]|uniref:O-antigen ligase family protein n=1 Tax=Desulforhabdus sp. TSK TaxID=2925014 RepID=UPI001FC891F1|nr:O-antigen ligase family protein [Desulforhabdus sp. TSK]GKT08909.1 hypothetical protein DSTSK_22140 [Desulforhabdus sp. TSK]